MTSLEKAKNKYGIESKADTWKELSRIHNLSEDFIREFADRVDWYYVSEYQKLSESFIKEFAGKVDWYCISAYQKLSESFIREFADKVDWYCISAYQKLSEVFIEEYSNNIDWSWISKYQKLSEDFIRKFSDRVDWKRILGYQKLSENFIAEFSDKVDWYYICKYQTCSKEFLNEFGHGLNNNSDKPTSYWKEAIEKTGMYECHEDYFIGYKGIRADRYSKYNFQYQYLPGETYKCFSDYSNDESSFGLSVWDERGAYDYCNELVIKVKVYYEDITAVVHNGGKIRCKKLTVLD